MAIRTILTCLLNEASASLLAEAAADLADRYDAHLVGQHTHELVVVHPGIESVMAGPSYESFNAARTAQAVAIEAVFRATVERRGIRAEWRGGDAGEDLASDRMIESARAADFVVMGRPDRDYDRDEQRLALDRVVRESGRPVLLVPDRGLRETFGRRALVAHAGTRESARAAFDLLPMLAGGAEVHVVHVGDESDEMRDRGMTELCAAIARHGHEVSMAHLASRGRSIADALLEVAAQTGADVVAAGAYSHFRVHAFFFGDTTGALVRDARVPILFST